ncbi:hypothetical protein GCM10007860_34730 [Chitiniphilus shinanonensis]|uniref:KfrA N-terminal DNA-binding domain-containing protein n=1 Tax=Chitiniphilus shinanonensis TaxID=553088 RepID=A0ABQ6BWD5_9NEIS|nr:hypothetical protein [Chitiniphilus shinanonensis]GLS06295.1 hypothetical protein GCM10007860_34730 [Chitiniphilus shinanonensis]
MDLSTGTGDWPKKPNEHALNAQLDEMFYSECVLPLERLHEMQPQWTGAHKGLQDLLNDWWNHLPTRVAENLSRPQLGKMAESAMTALWELALTEAHHMAQATAEAATRDAMANIALAQERAQKAEATQRALEETLAQTKTNYAILATRFNASETRAAELRKDLTRLQKVLSDVMTERREFQERCTGAEEHCRGLMDQLVEAHLRIETLERANRDIAVKHRIDSVYFGG